MSGFRGVKGRVSIDVPSGFLIITGRNGSGKSTFCDAIEYVFSGGLRRESGHTEKRESIDDYVWWRGKGKAETHEVVVTLKDDKGTETTLSRGPNGPNFRTEDLETLVTIVERAPQNAIEHFCRSTVLRDEQLTNLSVDMPEAERYSFVRAALAGETFDQVLTRTTEVKKTLEGRQQELEKSQSEFRSRLNLLTEELSRLQAEVARSQKVPEAEELIQAETTSARVERRELLSAAAALLSSLRKDEVTLETSGQELEVIQPVLAAVQSEEHKTKVEALKEEIQTSKNNVATLDEKLAFTAANLAGHRAKQPTLTMFAELKERGEELGLQAGHCPLCGSLVEEASFDSALQSITDKVSTESAHLTELISDQAKLARDLDLARDALRKNEKSLKELRDSEAAAISREQAVMDSVKLILQSTPTRGEALLSAVREARAEVSERIRKLSDAISTVRSSLAFEACATKEHEIGRLRENLEAGEREMSRVAALVRVVAEAERIVPRVAGDIVDERLARLSPLIKELYYRLRPHIDWREMDYHLRGDVRRFLSFGVSASWSSDQLNPNFLFSSGQRRAAGLAVLLAVHLSRGWSRLRSLVLDDPVQHIDDYRAVQLTEILSAMRRSGHQVICTVEDPALARLLGRHLSRGFGGEGALVTLAYHSQEGTVLQDRETIPPVSARVLRSA